MPSPVISRPSLLLWAAAAFLPGLRAAAQDPEVFEKQVRPALHAHCTECHGAEKQKGGLRLDSRAAILTGGESGPAVVPGNPEASLLLKAAGHGDPELIMPPPAAGPKLPGDTIARLTAWVRSGAPGPEGGEPAEPFGIAARKERLPWIWQTPRLQTVPDGPGPTAVDRFLYAGLAAAGLSPAPPADDLTWLRRVHFAITGLPPRRDEMEAFLAAPPARRREQTVDALLASPHFGERWARHWMDLVRYAESRGHEEDFRIANAWRYRDYLIRAINADVPYDAFVREHLAGDLLPPRIDPATGANESVIATGWAFLGEENHSPVDIRQDECERVDNKIDVLSKTFLGLTVACARCHDHKFDAISQRDYYALSGFMLASPFRQVRYETMASHAAAAAALADIRSRHLGELRSRFAAAARPGAETIAAQLMAARRVLFGAPPDSAPPAWVDQLKQAATDPSHVLHAFSLLAHEPDAENPARFPELRAACLPAPPAARPEAATLIADFTTPGATAWKVDGPAFGARPLESGDAIPGPAERPLLSILPYRAAVSDVFWNRLAAAPGTEMDAGALGAAGRSGKTLLTPKVRLLTGKVHYLIRGSAQVYAGVDSHLMIEGPLHRGLVTSFDTGGRLCWVTHDLSAYAGHRAHFEFAPQGGSPLELLMVAEAPNPPAWLPVTPWTWKGDEPSLEAIAGAFQSAVIRALGSTAAGPAPADSREAQLAGWALQNTALPGTDPAAWAPPGNDYARETGDLAKTIRWESALAVSWGDLCGLDEQILLRGKPSRPGAAAPRGLPEAFGFPRITSTGSSGRVELASQITRPDNPLTARVFVNRVWHHLFGRGLVPTVDNFGFLGERPSHPELLDHLAAEFSRSGRWSLKQLIRKLVLTEAFARSSRGTDPRAEEIDPSNSLLHRMNVRRLEGEAIRDALLVISGRFDATAGGPPVPLYLTEFTVGRGSPGASGPLDGAGRRSLYTALRRNFLSSMMQAFDMPVPFSTVGRRNVTSVPAQSLVMMNDPFVREQAAVWAARLLRELPEAAPEARIAWLFETAFTRRPGAEEMTAALETVTALRGLSPDGSGADLWTAFAHALLNANDAIYLK